MVISKTSFENWFFPLFDIRYLLQYQEPIPCEQLVTALCDIKQAYTQFGGNEVWWIIVLLNVLTILLNNMTDLSLWTVLLNSLKKLYLGKK